MRITHMMINAWKKNWKDVCCPWGVLLSMRYTMDPTIVLPSTVEYHLDVPMQDVVRFMRKHDMTHNLSNADLARMMGVEYSEGVEYSHPCEVMVD